MREVHTRRSCSSVITMSYDVEDRPRWMAVATPVTMPERGRAVVGGVDVHPDGDLRRIGVDGGPDGSEGLGEHDGRPAVQEAERLGVALDRHGRDDPLRCDLDELDAHLVVQAAVALREEGDELLDAQVRQRRGRVPSRSWRRVDGPAGRTDVGAAPTRVARVARDERADRAPASSCSTATPWPTARSSRCRWRTSRPPPASTPTRSTASPRCWSTCCATSSPPTSRSPSTCRGRPSASSSTPTTRPTATRRPTSSAASCR